MLNITLLSNNRYIKNKMLSNRIFYYSIIAIQTISCSNQTIYCLLDIELHSSQLFLSFNSKLLFIL